MPSPFPKETEFSVHTSAASTSIWPINASGQTWWNRSSDFWIILVMFRNPQGKGLCTVTWRIKQGWWIYVMVQMACENLYLKSFWKRKTKCNIGIASAFYIYWKFYVLLNHESAPSTNTRNFFYQGYLYSFIPHHS